MDSDSSIGTSHLYLFPETYRSKCGATIIAVMIVYSYRACRIDARGITYILILLLTIQRKLSETAATSAQRCVSSLDVHTSLILPDRQGTYIDESCPSNFPVNTPSYTISSFLVRFIVSFINCYYVILISRFQSLLLQLERTSHRRHI